MSCKTCDGCFTESDSCSSSSNIAPKTILDKVNSLDLNSNNVYEIKKIINQISGNSYVTENLWQQYYFKYPKDEFLNIMKKAIELDLIGIKFSWLNEYFKFNQDKAADCLINKSYSNDSIWKDELIPFINEQIDIYNLFNSGKNLQALEHLILSQ